MIVWKVKHHSQISIAAVVSFIEMVLKLSIAQYISEYYSITRI